VPPEATGGLFLQKISASLNILPTCAL